MTTVPDRLRRGDYVVMDCPLRLARRLVTEHHYARGASNTAVFCHGLFRRVDMALCGVAWWIPPIRSCAEATYPNVDWRLVLALSRLVITPETPHNACTFLLAGSVRIIQRTGKWELLVTYADTWRGHTGTIYRAANWTYCGLSRPSDVWLAPNGQMVSSKAGPRTRTREEMLRLGYTCAGKHAKHKYTLRLKPLRKRREVTVRQPQLPLEATE